MLRSLVFIHTRVTQLHDKERTQREEEDGGRKRKMVGGSKRAPAGESKPGKFSTGEAMS